MSDRLSPAPSSALLKQAHRRINARLKALQKELEEIGDKQVSSERAFHNTRVLTRKIQAGLLAFKPLLRKKVRRRIQEEIREIRQSASGVRDLDVCLKMIQQAERKAPPTTRAAFDFLKQSLQTQRAQVLDQFQHHCFDAGHSPVWQKIRRQLDREFQEQKGLSGTPEVEDFGLWSIQAAWQEVLIAFENFDSGSEADEDLHELRKKIKRFRYTVELFPASLEEKDKKVILSSCKRVQDALGKVTDILMLRQLSFREALQIRRGTPELRISFTHFYQWLDESELKLRDQFRQAWDKYFVPIAQLGQRKSWPLPGKEDYSHPPEKQLN